VNEEETKTGDSVERGIGCAAWANPISSTGSISWKSSPRTENRPSNPHSERIHLGGQPRSLTTGMEEYHRLLRRVLTDGKPAQDRTGTGTLSVFGAQARFDLRETFPCLTTKKLHLRSIIHELLWFLKGDTNAAYLNDHKVTIWDEWADEQGDLGPVYGKQWRRWQGAPDAEPIDQIAQVIAQIRTIRRAAGSSSRPGIRWTSRKWPCRPATASSNFTSATGN